MLAFVLQATPGNPIPFNLIFMVAIIAVMYFFFMRPQMKKQKEQEAFQTNMKSGAEVVTTSGIIGKVSSVADDHVVLIIGDKTKIKLLKSAISKELTEMRTKVS